MSEPKSNRRVYLVAGSVDPATTTKLLCFLYSDWIVVSDMAEEEINTALNSFGIHDPEVAERFFRLTLEDAGRIQPRTQVSNRQSGAVLSNDGSASVQRTDVLLPSDMTDSQLIAKCLSETGGQGEKAWREFVDRFTPLLATTIRRTISRWAESSPALVNDLLQEVYYRLCDDDCRALRGFRWLHENSFRGFLKVVASNMVRDHFKKYPPLESLSAEELPVAVQHLLSAEQASNDVRWKEIFRAVQTSLFGDHFSKRDSAIFLLYYRYGLSSKEISKLYGLSARSVERALAGLVRKIRSELQSTEHPKQGTVSQQFAREREKVKHVGVEQAAEENQLDLGVVGQSEGSENPRLESFLAALQ